MNAALYRDHVIALQSCYSQAKSNTNQLAKLAALQTAQLSEKMSQQAEIACTKGCSTCCNIRVLAFPHEVIAIYFYIKTELSREQSEALITRIKSTAAMLKNITTEQHDTTNIECPLLFNDACSVYPVRSLACAGYHSTSLSQCQKSYSDPTDLTGFIPQVREIQIAQERLTQATYQVLHHNKEPLHKVELISSLGKLLASPTLINKWRKGRKVFTP
ncbi:YkgJ family cysteine cluster protein [Motilimonas sp. E26]|uniref:YkgJ family cysteine cluster protein n=1 Tax=Motilimonas sp. E26 TaxID=2865674 RepID=UPI001E578537|nr:YkgJ family cysteine cluster protein [Motilimonas sp. E26]MCE0557067.1 YkgJ family cysteine cluster protein [Motilimonas sp. E26]